MRVGAGHAGERILGDGENDRNDGQSQRDARYEGVQSRLVVEDALQHGGHDEQGKNTDHDRGNSRKQFNGRLDDFAGAGTRELGNINGGAHGQRHGEEQANQGDF